MTTLRPIVCNPVVSGTPVSTPGPGPSLHARGGAFCMSDLVASGFPTEVAGCSLRPDEPAQCWAAQAARASGLRQPGHLPTFPGQVT